LTHEQIGLALGRSRVWVTNLLRLLELDGEVKELLSQGGIAMGHARAMLPLAFEQQRALARKAERLQMSVRQVERAVNGILAELAAPSADPETVDLQTRWLQSQIAHELGQDVAIRAKKNGRYTLQVDFANLAGLQSALERLEGLVARIRETAGPRVRDAS
jgi:ParB family chromosome partitioning protein